MLDLPHWSRAKLSFVVVMLILPWDPYPNIYLLSLLNARDENVIWTGLQITQI